MFTIIVAALLLAAPDSAGPHVRSSEPRIRALIDAGVASSPTFRGLIAALNASDVIVYLEPNVRRQSLGGYLDHRVVSHGQYRYLRIAVEIAGSERRLVSLLAHELQHAVEVARAPDARDTESVRLLFGRLAVAFGCGGTSCLETQAARDVENIVRMELVAPVKR
jgi:hypothetical protein